MDGSFFTISYNPEFICDSSVFIFVETVDDNTLDSSSAVGSIHDKNCSNLSLFGFLCFKSTISDSILVEEFGELISSRIWIIHEKGIS